MKSPDNHPQSRRAWKRATESIDLLRHTALKESKFLRPAKHEPYFPTMDL